MCAIRRSENRSFWSWTAFVLLMGFGFTGAAAQLDISSLPEPARTKVDFVRDIQPILQKHCYSCHGPEKQENDLRWDTKTSALRTTQPLVIPGQSAESRMIHLVGGLEKDLVMPAKGPRLTADQVALLRAWIDQGADWPDAVAAPKSKDKADWWSFKPAIKPPLPAGKKAGWVRNEIDLFVLAKLREQNLAPSPEADRRTLIRRLSFNLIGLPPTPEEVDQFLRDKSSTAYEKLVDRLLASPRYGERWARHWLDTVHYADTHGYDKDKPRPHAWPYRDYVIRSLNGDKNYSRFVQEQLAGDVLFPDEPDGIVALGFIAAGPWDFVGHVELPIEKTDGLIARYNDRDDMVMTAMSTFQSLTVHCARCHNHKFDAITQRDYYALQAVFAGVDRADRTFDLEKQTSVRRRELAAQKRPLQEKHAALTNRMAAISNAELEKLDADLKRLRDHAVLAGFAEGEKSPGNGYHSGIEKTQEATKWVQVDLGAAMQLDDVVLVPARPVDFPDTPGFGFPLRFRVEISDVENFATAQTIADHTGADFKNRGDEPVSFAAGKKRGRYVRITATRLWERTSDYVFALAEMQVFVNQTNAAFGAAVSSLDSIEAGFWSKTKLVDGFDSRKKLPNATGTVSNRQKLEREVQSLGEKRARLAESLLDPALRAELSDTTNQLARVEADLAALPSAQKVYAAASDFVPEGSFLPPKTPRPVHLLSRGDVKRPGDLMGAGAVEAIAASNEHFNLAPDAGEAARRAGLAKWITDTNNMLTRRSIVNRAWHYHFGRGIVETPNDFGHMGALPTHPELLDWMAFWFLENGESLKKLHRLIVTSATYRQRSASDSPFARIDADNRYLWRMNRTRLDAETTRDSMLALSGKLDLTMGGPSVQQFYFKDDHSPVYDYTQFDVDSTAANRRSVYRFVVRSVPDPLMDTLDCPDASILTAKRNVTMTSLQALAVLNNPFVLKQCEHFATRLENSGGSLSQRIEKAYLLALNRKATAEEVRALKPFAERHGLASLCRLIFNTSEFMFVD